MITNAHTLAHTWLRRQRPTNQPIGDDSADDIAITPLVNFGASRVHIAHQRKALRCKKGGWRWMAAGRDLQLVSASHCIENSVGVEAGIHGRWTMGSCDCPGSSMPTKTSDCLIFGWFNQTIYLCAQEICFANICRHHQARSDDSVMDAAANFKTGCIRRCTESLTCFVVMTQIGWYWLCLVFPC